jgi:hypothetical protein
VCEVYVGHGDCFWLVLGVESHGCMQHGRRCRHVEFAGAKEAKKVLVGKVGRGRGRLRLESR